MLTVWQLRFGQSSTECKVTVTFCSCIDLSCKVFNLCAILSIDGGTLTNNSETCMLGFLFDVHVVTANDHVTSAYNIVEESKCY